MKLSLQRHSTSLQRRLQSRSIRSSRSSSPKDTSSIQCHRCRQEACTLLSTACMCLARKDGEREYPIHCCSRGQGLGSSGQLGRCHRLRRECLEWWSSQQTHRSSPPSRSTACSRKFRCRSSQSSACPHLDRRSLVGSHARTRSLHRNRYQLGTGRRRIC